jgi:hypothetical protein
LADKDVISRSVTKNDQGDASQGGGVFHWVLNYAVNAANEVPAWWSPARDYYLRNLINRESAWAGAVAIASTKITSTGWDIEGTTPRIRNDSHELIMQWMMEYSSRDALDFLTTDNGCFTEIVRATNGVGSRIIGLIALDSLRCTRTNDPENPVIYTDTQGHEHLMKSHQVMMLCDMPDPSETMNGVGHCAASRALMTVLKMESIERYIYEKVSGKRPLVIYLTNGISEPQMRTAMEATHEDSKAKGQVSYMGAAIIPTLSDVTPTLLTIPLAELPDGFDRTQEFNQGMLLYANAIGLDPQDLQPLTGSSLGSGAQSVILHEKAQGHGLAYYRQQKTHMFNENVLAETVTFAYSENDLRDKQQRAQIDATIVSTHTAQIAAGIINAQQAAQMEADEEIIPREFVPDDNIDSGSLTDAEKPEAVDAASNASNEQDAASVAPVVPPPAPAAPVTATTKELRDRFADALARFDEAMTEKAFDPSQPRNDNGEWSETGGGGSKMGEDKRSKSEIDAINKSKYFHVGASSEGVFTGYHWTDRNSSDKIKHSGLKGVPWDENLGFTKPDERKLSKTGAVFAFPELNIDNGKAEWGDNAVVYKVTGHGYKVNHSQEGNQIIFRADAIKYEQISTRMR